MIKKTNKSLGGTSFYGSTITATVADLMNVLGAPDCTGDSQDKVQNEWELELEDGTVFSVYDWKEYRRYTDTEEIEWHIGGMSEIATYRAQCYLEEALAEGININEQQTKTDNMSSKPNLFQSVKSFVNSKKVGDTFTTKEFHAAMEGIEFITGWKKWSAGKTYRQDQYKGYLRRLGFLQNTKRGEWRVLCNIPAWLDSGHVNSALGYMYSGESVDGKWQIKYTPYKDMTKEEIVAKINDYIYHNGITTVLEEAPKVEVDRLKEYEDKQKQLILDLARDIVGDGKSPNVLFVTTSAQFLRCKDGECEYFTLDGFTSEDRETYGPFYSYVDACNKYDELELDPYEGIGSVVIEDRKIGTVKEKFLEERITVDFTYGEHDDSKFLYK